MRKRSPLVLILLFSIVTIGNSFGQRSANWCGQVSMDQQLKEQHPERIQDILDAENQLLHELSNYENQRGARALKVIPVVFHIIHQNGTENISDAQVFDQVRILNEDYSGTNADISDVVASFTSVIGNMDIEFRLAQLDPNGNSTNGIDRIVSAQTNNGGDAAKLNTWPRSSYLNIWVVKSWGSGIPNGVLAYAYKPGSAQSFPADDGIICLSQYIGSIGTGLPLYARTISHEIGHYLNLSHTWGNTNNPGQSTNCNGDDGINDTPNCIGTFGCNTSYQSCGSLDNTQNHMDYSDCTVMFTQGQAVVVNAALNSTVAQRNNLSTAQNLNATGVNQLTFADFTANRLTICQYESIDFTDLSEYDPNSWAWSISGGQSGSSTDQDPTEVYSSPGVYDVSLTSSNATNSVSENKVGYIMVNPILGKFAPYMEDFSSVNQLNHENWYAVNDFNDAYQFEADATSGFSGSAAIKMENYGNTNKTEDELLTTTYDLRLFSSVNISFKVAYAQKTSSDATKLVFYVSNDCGKTWTPRWSGYGPTMSNVSVTPGYYTPSSNADWKTINVSNISGNLLAQTNQFKFVFENMSGNNLYIDDFNITGNYTDIAQLKYPLNGQTSVPNTQTIAWKAIGNGVDAYEYQLDSEANFSTSNLQTGINNFIAITDGLDTEYTPSGLTNGQTYFWRVRLIKGGQAQAWSSVWNFTVANNGVSTQDILVHKYQFKLYPNPMKEFGVLEFSLEKGKNVDITVTNMVGKSYTIQEASYYGAGTHLFNLSEMKFTPGFYFLNLNIEGETVRQKFIVQ
jgi:PKD repeat protein